MKIFQQELDLNRLSHDQADLRAILMEQKEKNEKLKFIAQRKYGIQDSKPDKLEILKKKLKDRAEQAQQILDEAILLGSDKSEIFELQALNEKIKKLAVKVVEEDEFSTTIKK